MRALFATAWPGRRLWRRRPLGGSPRTPRTVARVRFASAYARARSQSGLTLIEVLVASMLVAVIAVGTFTAFDAAGRSSADTRAHAQAAQLAGQEEERLRGLTTTQVAQLGSVETTRAENGACLEKVAGVWKYWNKEKTFFCEKTGEAGKAYSATAFTVTSSSRYVTAPVKSGEKAALTCEKTGGAANYLQTTSSVTWSSLGTRTPVSQSSIITAPTSGVLLIKVVNQNSQPVEGATVTVTGTPLNATAFTPAAGCVNFGGLSAGTVNVTASKLGWIDPQGKSSATKNGIGVTANSVTELTLKLAEPGSIVAEFESTGSVVGIKGDTFYALQTEMTAPPDFVGGTAGAYASTATLERLLFPFAKAGKPEAYTVFAGDCEANNPAKVTEAGEKLVDRTAEVLPNGNGVPAVKVEVPPVNVTVYEGSKAEVEAAEKAKLTPKYITGTPEAAMIINKGCEAGKAQNYAGAVPYKHKVSFTAEGHLNPLEGKYQPYATELQLCVVAKLGATYYKYKSPAPFANKVKAGITIPSVYMKSAEKAKEYEHTNTAGKLTCP